jgi:hypothetical protein
MKVFIIIIIIIKVSKILKQNFKTNGRNSIEIGW